MSFDQLSSLEAGSGGGGSRQPRRGDGGGSSRSPAGGAYHDDPEFSRLTTSLMNQLFRLTGNNARLQTEISHLSTRRDTARVRERVHDLLEESRALFKEVGEGVKKVQVWEDVSVRSHDEAPCPSMVRRLWPESEMALCDVEQPG